VPYCYQVGSGNSNFNGSYLYAFQTDSNTYTWLLSHTFSSAEYGSLGQGGNLLWYGSQSYTLSLTYEASQSWQALEFGSDAGTGGFYVDGANGLRPMSVPGGSFNGWIGKFVGIL
jgi:hypothetical protein